ncbi:spore coat protein U-like protein [Luteibacter sp. Sphag1AF]|uniref:Csu type fimbrial protein n=1 Tax=Luteibacter sp. Sphag1AF TaxID=2587031 RepID=UPI00161D1691|nr:spore coat U domain-containing protein [Luteibacter sp. Sphag1AF]MBB3227923.1 spore coat protein U-like protein [Luteibacter sp. Sphag1AF]
MKMICTLLLLLAALCFAPGAQATTTCKVNSVTAVAFGPVQPTSGNITTMATLTYSCSYTGGVIGALSGAFVRMCVSLGPGANNLYNPRTMLDSSGDAMTFNIYKDSGHSQIWGSSADTGTTPNNFTTQFGILSTGTSTTGTITLYGQVPGPQAGLAFGSYTATLTSSMAYAYNEVLLSLGTYPTTCTNGSTGNGTSVGPSVSVTANSPASCAIGTATDLSFGTVPGFLNTVTDQTSLVRVTCSNRSPFQIGLDNGQNALAGQRRMVNGTNHVSYELYANPGRTTRWGNTLNTDTVSSAGTGIEQDLTVYGRVPVQTPVPPGNYSDVITVTLTY